MTKCKHCGRPPADSAHYPVATAFGAYPRDHAYVPAAPTVAPEPGRPGLCERCSVDGRPPCPVLCDAVSCFDVQRAWDTAQAEIAGLREAQSLVSAGARITLDELDTARAALAAAEAEVARLRAACEHVEDDLSVARDEIYGLRLEIDQSPKLEGE